LNDYLPLNIFLNESSLTNPDVEHLYVKQILSNFEGISTCINGGASPLSRARVVTLYCCRLLIGKYIQLLFSILFFYFLSIYLLFYYLPMFSTLQVDNFYLFILNQPCILMFSLAFYKLFSSYLTHTRTLSLLPTD
jgi:hypothetical protein